MRRIVGLFIVCGLVLPLTFAASAAGQGATLRVNDQTPAPGQQVQVTGSGFSFTAGHTSPSIRLDRRAGVELGTGTVSSQGILQPIPITVTIPANLSPGWHLLIATQTVEANSRAVAFTPGRVRINVGGSGAGGASAPPPGGGGLPGSPLGLLALAGALLLVAAGATLTARRLRTNNQPQLGS